MKVRSIWGREEGRNGKGRDEGRDRRGREEEGIEKKRLRVRSRGEGRNG